MDSSHTVDILHMAGSLRRTRKVESHYQESFQKALQGTVPRTRYQIRFHRILCHRQSCCLYI